MATNEFAVALDVLRRTRIEAVLSAPRWDDQSTHEWLAAALDTLAEGVKAEAALWEQHKKKGWQGTKANLLFTAGKLNDLAKEADEVGSKPKPTDEEGNRLRDPGRGIEPGGDPSQEGVAPRAPIASPYAQPRGNDAGEPDAVAVEEHLIRLEAERGEPVSPSAESLAIFADTPAQPIHDEVHTEVREAMAAEDPFSDPVSAVRLAPPLTYADLMRAIPARADVPHWSYSQLSTLDDCGVKYAATKMLNMPQIPQWSLVGGKAFHSAVELIEREIHGNALSELIELGNIGAIWSTTFSAAIAEQAAEAPVPPAQWRAASKGAEGFDWWRVEGERMLTAYVELRRKLIDVAMNAGLQPRELLNVQGLPILEAELTIDVPGPMGNVPFMSVLDQAWTVFDRSTMTENILIVDIKTGKSAPTDTFQLGSQALVLAQHMGLPAHARDLLKACYYDARKGIFSEAFSAIERHPYEELVYRVHTAEHQRRTGVYRPRVSPFCNGCAVKYACPLVGA